jgi:hypothetical protein
MAQGKTITQLPLILSADSSSSTIIVKDGVTSQIQYSALTVSPEVFQTTVDSKLGLTGGTVDGQVQIVSSLSSEVPGQSSQLLPTTGWTSNGWTGNFTTGFTHTTGNTTTLVSTYSASPATTYVLKYDIIPTNTTYDIYFGQNGEYLNTSLNVTNTVGCSSNKEVNAGFICYDGFQVKYFITNDAKSGTQCINGNCPKGFKCEGGECVVDLDSGVWSEKYVGYDCAKVVASPCTYATAVNIGCRTCCNARPIYQVCDGQQEVLGYTNECATYGPSKSVTYEGPNGIIYTELLEEFIDNITFNDTFRGRINYGSSCDGNADCGPGYVCLNGYCVRQIITSSMISGLECASSTYCPQGFTCNNGNCEPDLASGFWIEIGEKPGGYPIYQGPGGVELHTGWGDAEDYSLYENPNSYEGEYRQTCSIDNDCPKGFVCVNGYCVKLIQTSNLFNGMSNKGVCGCPTGYKTNPVYPYTATTSCFADLESGYWANVGTSSNNANGTVTISFGGISATTNTSGSIGVYAKNYSPLRVSPTSNFNGLLLTYLREVTGTTTSTFSLSDGNSTNVTQLRGGTFNLTNNFIGVDAGNQNVSGERNLSFGQNSLTSNVAGNKNLAIGVDSLKSIVGVDSNIAIGDSTLLNNGYGSNNVAIGTNSMSVDKDPNCSVAVGYNSLSNNSEIDGNVAIGCSAGEKSNVPNTVYIGARSGLIDLGEGSTFVGYESGLNNIGNYNTFLGNSAGYSNTSGDNLTFIGYNSGLNNTSGSENTFIGSESGVHNQDGIRNVAIGYYAGAFTLDGVTENTSPDRSVYIGSYTKSFNVNDTNSIVIGFGAESQGDNTVVIGNDNTETIYLNGDLNVTGADSTSFNVNDFGINSTDVITLVTDSLSIQNSQGNGYNLTTTSGQNGQVLTYTNGNAIWQNTSGDGNVTGSGTLNYIPKWSGSTGLRNSVIFDNGSFVSVGYNNLLISFIVSANTFNIGKGGSTSSRALFMGKSIPSTWLGSDSCGQFDFNNPGGDQGVVIRTNAGYVGTGGTPVAGGIISVQGNAKGLILAGNPVDENHLVIDNFGKVGIGTNIPTQRFHVSGNTLLQGNLTATTISATTYLNLPSTGIYGTGTTNYIPVWTGSTSLGNSSIYDDGNFIGFYTDTQSYSEKVSIQTGMGILVDDLMIIENSGSLAIGTRYDYATWGTNGGEIAIGTRGVLENSTGSSNIGIGDKSLQQNTSGHSNVSIGVSAMMSNSTGSQNISIGLNSLFSSNGDRNISIGDNSGFSSYGTGNIYLGYQSGYNNSGDSNIFIGNGTYYPIVSGSNKISIANYIYGDSSSKTFGINVTAQTNSLHVSASTNPVRFEGLQTNTGATKIVIADNNGVLYTETKPKKYVALLTQTGTSAPTAIVLENTLGNITFGYVSTGKYTVTATGLLTLNKTTVITGGAVCSIDTLTVNGFSLISYGLGFSSANTILNNSTIEISVYP